MALEKELEYFNQIKAELLQHNKEQFALIKETELIGTFTKMEEAYSEGVKRFGNVPFLIKQILENEPKETLTTLTAGLIRARL